MLAATTASTLQRTQRRSLSSGAISRARSSSVTMLRISEASNFSGLAQSRSPLNDLSSSHAAGRLEMAFGKAEMTELLMGEALSLALTYAFEELNLYRLSAAVPAYDLDACRGYEKAGYTLEVCQRQAIFRDGRYWDWLLYGILSEEWAASRGRN